MPPLCRILREAPLDDVIQSEWESRNDARGYRWINRQNRRYQTSLAFSLESSAARDHFVEHRAKRKDIGTGVGVLAFELLRRHVLQRPENRARSGQALGIRWVGGRRLACAGRLVSSLCQTEVEQLRSFCRQHDVA